MESPPGPDDLDATIAHTLTLIHRISSREIANETLLRRPPFRFLHDVAVELMVITGFGMGLWDGDELDAVGLRSVEGREGKSRFIAKLAALVCVGKRVSACPFRVPAILAGQQVDRTTTMLQVGTSSAEGRPPSPPPTPAAAF